MQFFIAESIDSGLRIYEIKKDSLLVVETV